MKRFLIVTGIVLSLLAGWAQAQQKPKSPQEQKKEFDEFKPGSDSTYSWVETIKEGLAAIKEQKSLGLFYFYNPDEKLMAFRFEKVFAETSTVGGKFVCVKINSKPEKTLEGPWQKFKGRTCVAFIDPNGVPVRVVPPPASPKAFQSLAEAVEKKYAKATKTEEEGKKKEGEEKEGKKEEEKKEKKEEK
jgi:hypothetical protein